MLFLMSMKINFEGVIEIELRLVFDPYFITIVLTENFDITVLNDELVSRYLIEEGHNIYDEVMGSLNVIFF